jgi:type III restriction enzyme
MLNVADFQEKKIIEISNQIDALLNSNLPSNMQLNALLEAPTGSGKTLICANAIKLLFEKRNDFIILWLSIGNGENVFQSYNAFKEKYGLSKCSLFDTLNRFTKESKIYFASWNFLKDKNKYGENNFIHKKENMDFSFAEYLDLVKANKKIILFIDESHHTASSLLSQEIINAIKPFLTFEITATPLNNKAYVYEFKINHDEVRDSGIIKNYISINDYINIEKGMTDEVLLIKSAENKRIEIIQQYEKMGINNINPLVIIQCKQEDVPLLKETIKSNSLGIEDHEFSLWYADKKINTTNLKNNNDSVKYIFCNQAIATGWDCPRAHILVQLISIKSNNFEIQTVGRVLRTVEQKKYNNDILDTAYVFTKVSENEDYINLYLSNQNTIGSSVLSTDLIGKKDWVNKINNLLLSKSINKEALSITSIYKQYEHSVLLEIYCNAMPSIFSGETYKNYEIEIDHQKLDSLNKTTIKQSEKKYIKRNFDTYFIEMTKKYNLQMIDTSRLLIPYKNRFNIKNDDFPNEIFELTKKFLVEGEKINIKSSNYQVKEIYERTPIHHHKRNYNKTIYSDINGSFIQKLSTPELIFITDFLERNSQIECWMKNFDWGENGLSFIYKDQENKEKYHFPDFITIQNNQICIYEIKDYTNEEIINEKTNQKWKYMKQKINIKDNFMYEVIYVDKKLKQFYIKTLVGIQKM